MTFTTEEKKRIREILLFARKHRFSMANQPSPGIMGNFLLEMDKGILIFYTEGFPEPPMDLGLMRHVSVYRPLPSIFESTSIDFSSVLEVFEFRNRKREETSYEQGGLCAGVSFVDGKVHLSLREKIFTTDDIPN